MRRISSQSFVPKLDALLILSGIIACMGLLSSCSKQSEPAQKTPPNYQFKGFRAQTGASPASPRYLTGEIREFIEANKGPWSSIVIHSSGGRGERFSALERHHKQVLGLPEGLAYHFLIGDGTAEQAGAIHVSERWKQNLKGEALRTQQEQRSIHICLLGRRQDAAPIEQLAALDELLALLQPRYSTKIYAHDQVEEVVPKVGCPGKRLQESHWRELKGLYPQFVTLP